MTRYEAVCRLIQRRNELRIPQHVIAAATGVSAPMVSHWERGRNPIPTPALLLYADLVGMTVRISADEIEVSDA